MRVGKRQRPCRGVVLAALVLAASLTGAARADQLREAIRLRTKGNASSVKSQEQIDNLTDQTDRLMQEYRAVVQQIDGLRVYNKQVETLVAAQEKEAGSLQTQIDQVALVGRQLTPLMLKMIEALDSFVKLDVPFLVEERTARVAQLRELMGRADVTDAERYRRILEAYQVENEYGRTIEAYRGALELGGESRTVDFLRIGRIALIYQTLDGAEAGVWDAAKGGWTRLSGRYRVPIRKGLRIARKQAAPDLLKLPVAAAAAEAVR